MDTKNGEAKLRLFALAISVILLIVNIARILTIPATKDEVIIYPYLHNSYEALANLRVLVTANFHPLNLIITKFCITHFADNLFFLRFGSLLAFCIYLFYSWRISQYCFRAPLLPLASFLLLNLNPFLLEFWTLSRGYGLAIAFMTASIYYAIRYLQESRIILLVLAFALALPSVYSNFSLLYYYIGLLTALAAGLLYTHLRDAPAKHFTAAFTVATATSIALYLLIAEPIKKLVTAKELYHGGNTGIYTDTLKTLVKESLFAQDTNTPLVTAVAWLAIGVVLTASVCTAQALARKERSHAAASIIFFLLLLTVPLLANTVQHYKDGALYLIDRAALFLYVPFVLVVLSALQMLSRRASAVAFFFTALAILNLVHTYSLNSTWTWAFDSANTTVLTRMNNYGPQSRKIRFRSFWLFGESMEYHVATTHRERFDISRTDMHLHEPVDTSQDYYYVPVEFQSKFEGNFVVDTLVTVINPDAYNGRYVLLRRQR